MSTQNPQQPGPIAQQLVKMQVNGHQAPSGAASGQHPVQGKPQKRAAQWTGFAGKTLWDWLNLLGAAVLIPVVIAAASIWFSVQQSQLANQQHDSDQAIALDQQRQAVLQICEDNIKDLLLTKGLHTSKPGDGVRSVAHAETLASLHQLDGERKGLLIQFLYEADLITIHPSGDVIITLYRADLSGVDLRDVYLSHADLGYAYLSRANLSGADLSDTNLSHVDLRGADLRGADLHDAFLNNADLGHAYLSRANLHGARLHGAHLGRGNLSYANLGQADLGFADLSFADLSHAAISQGQLQQASSLQGATMPDGSKHP